MRTVSEIVGAGNLVSAIFFLSGTSRYYHAIQVAAGGKGVIALPQNVRNARARVGVQEGSVTLIFAQSAMRSKRPILSLSKSIFEFEFVTEVFLALYLSAMSYLTKVSIRCICQLMQERPDTTTTPEGISLRCLTHAFLTIIYIFPSFSRSTKASSVWGPFYWKMQKQVIS